MTHRIRAALPVLEAQLTPEQLLHFLGLLDDPNVFTAEVVSAHRLGTVTLPDDVLRILVASLDQAVLTEHDRAGLAGAS